MKCPQCGIHYDDSERECPMCGARKPAFQKDQSQLARPTGTLATSSVKKKKKTEYVQTTSSAMKNKKKTQKGGMGKVVVIIIVLIVLLTSVLPSLLGTLEDVLTPSYEPDYGAAFPYGGTWADTGGTFQAVFYDAPEEYEIYAGDYVETGDYITYQNFESDFDFPEQFPADEYTWWTISLYPSEVNGGSTLPQSEVDEYLSSGGYLSVFQSRDNPDEIYFEDEFDQIPWMDGDTFYPVAADTETFTTAAPSFDLQQAELLLGEVEPV